MMTFFFTITFFLLITIAMAIGVLMGRKPLQGSCGGLGNIQGLGECDICGGDPSKCEEQDSERISNSTPQQDNSYYEV